LILIDTRTIIRLIINAYIQNETVEEVADRYDIAVTEAVVNELRRRSDILALMLGDHREVFLRMVMAFLYTLREKGKILSNTPNQQIISSLRTLLSDEKAEVIAQAIAASKDKGGLIFVTRDGDYAKPEIQRFAQEQGLVIIYEPSTDIKRKLGYIIP
jgi:predicted nucleic acid-binding protein